MPDIPAIKARHEAAGFPYGSPSPDSLEINEKGEMEIWADDGDLLATIHDEAVGEVYVHARTDIPQLIQALEEAQRVGDGLHAAVLMGSKEQERLERQLAEARALLPRLKRYLYPEAYGWKVLAADRLELAEAIARILKGE